MCLKDRLYACFFRVITFFIGAITLIYDFGVFNGTFKGTNLLYFTIISNLLCIILFLSLTLKTVIEYIKDGRYGTTSVSPHIKGCTIICILLTMIVYHFILIPHALKINPYQILKIPDCIFHYVMPFMTLLDWIIFDEKDGFKWYDPLLWIILPYIYIIIIFIQARYDIIARSTNHINRYIYVFLDVGTIGTKNVVSNVLSLTVAFIIIGYFIYGFDKIKVN